MIETYKKLDQILNNSLEQLSGFMCSRACCYDYGDDIKTSPHSYVNINKFIFEGNKFTEESIGKFENDIEHGVFHGVMTYLISTILDENINKNLKHDILEYHEHKVRAENDSNVFLNKRFEVSLDCYNNELDKFKIIPSCIFHDAYRVMIHHDNHDLKLKQYFPNLLNETYHHTNPYGVYETSLIVRSDRIELLRYSDYNKWVDIKLIFNNIPQYKIDLIKLFYSTIRPALEKAYQFRNNRWIRHGLECDIETFKFKNMYPSEYLGFWGEKKGVKMVLGSTDSSKKYWSIELGKGPLNDCFTKRLRPDFRPSYELLQGKIPLREFKSNPENNLYPCIIRDHLVASGESPTNDWIFTHHKLTDIELNNVISSNLKVCSESLLKKTIKCTSKIVDLFYALKVK